MTTTRPLLALALGAAAIGACDALDVFVPLPDFGGPAGVIEGGVTYTGPLPCTEAGRVVGAAALLAFDVKRLPPPEGLGTTPASLAIVMGETLFGGVKSQLVFNPGGERWCPTSDTPPVTVTAPFAAGPLPGGVYQIRGFYDYDGDFDPVFSIATLPTRGDIGGGAIENAAEVLAGKLPTYREVPLGDRQADDTFVIPDEGARVGGVAVTLALVLPFERPIFHVSEVLDPTGANTDPARVVMPSDFQLDTFSASPADVGKTEASFLRLKLGAGVAEDEVTRAAAAPFGLPVAPGGPCLVEGDEVSAPCFVYTRQDVNRDNIIDAEDVIPEGPVPSLYPLVILTKLASGKRIGGQTEPTVLLQGLTLDGTLAATALASPTLVKPSAEVLVALRPAVLCLDVADASKPGVLLTTRKTDKQGNPIIADEAAVKAKLEAQLKRTMDLAYGCLPQGELAINTVYDTGQAWTMPNEAGVCASSEEPSADGTKCGKRARLPSQGVVVTIGPPGEPAYCDANPTPAACLPH
jgi:hypothetical protein